MQLCLPPPPAAHTLCNLQLHILPSPEAIRPLHNADLHVGTKMMTEARSIEIRRRDTLSSAYPLLCCNCCSSCHVCDACAPFHGTSGARLGSLEHNLLGHGIGAQPVAALMSVHAQQAPYSNPHPPTRNPRHPHPLAHPPEHQQHALHNVGGVHHALAPGCVANTHYF